MSFDFKEAKIWKEKFVTSALQKNNNPGGTFGRKTALNFLISEEITALSNRPDLAFGSFSGSSGHGRKRDWHVQDRVLINCNGALRQNKFPTRKCGSEWRIPAGSVKDTGGGVDPAHEWLPRIMTTCSSYSSLGTLVSIGSFPLVPQVFHFLSLPPNPLFHLIIFGCSVSHCLFHSSLTMPLSLNSSHSFQFSFHTLNTFLLI